MLRFISKNVSDFVYILQPTDYSFLIIFGTMSPLEVHINHQVRIAKVRATIFFGQVMRSVQVLLRKI